MTFFTNDATIVVRFQVEGFHHWPGAKGRRAYLATDHRHMFHVEACIAVVDDDREVEFHDFLDFCRERFGGGQMGAKSCETMARALAEQVAARYGRSSTVKVFEDGEVGAIVSCIDWQHDGRPPGGWRYVTSAEAAE